MDMETQEIAPDLIAREDPSAATPLECMDGLDPLFNTKHTDGWKWDIPHSSVTSRGETEDGDKFCQHVFSGTLGTGIHYLKPDGTVIHHYHDGLRYQRTADLLLEQWTFPNGWDFIRHSDGMGVWSHHIGLQSIVRPSGAQEMIVGGSKYYRLAGDQTWVNTLGIKLVLRSADPTKIPSIWTYSDGSTHVIDGELDEWVFPHGSQLHRINAQQKLQLTTDHGHKWELTKTMDYDETVSEWVDADGIKWLRRPCTQPGWWFVAKLATSTNA